MKAKPPKDAPRKTKKRKGLLGLFRWGAPLPAAFLLAVGVALFFLPSENLRAFAVATGAVLCVVALCCLLGAFFGNANMPAIVAGAALVGLAIWLFVQPENAGSAVFYVLTAVIFLRATFGLFYSLIADRRESKLWQISMAGCIFLLVCAVVFFFLPSLEVGYLNVLLGALCCLAAFFEAVALLHRLSASGKKKEKAKKRGGKEELPPNGEPAAPTEDDKTDAGKESRRKKFKRKKREGEE